jgi:zinc transporter 9
MALLHGEGIEPFTPLIVGLLVLSLALEGWTFSVAFKEIGGLQGLRTKRHDVTVLAGAAGGHRRAGGDLLTLLVAGVSYVIGPHPEFDAIVAIVVGVMLGVMALALAALNRKLLIDTSDAALDTAATRWLGQRGIAARVSSLVLDVDRAIVFVRAERPVRTRPPRATR